MDCRRFHKDLEDYLDEGLDFRGRFGMERHAQQCIRCGKEMAAAQRLRRMVREMDRVKAPSNFEASVLNEIGNMQSRGCFSGLRRLWFYGFEFPSLRKLALASSCMALLAGGVFYFAASKSRRSMPEPLSSLPVPVNPKPVPVLAPVTMNQKAETVKSVPSRPKNLPLRAAADPEDLTQPPPPERERIVEEESMETDYVELQVIGPDNRPVSVYRQPTRLRYREAKTDEGYFLRNVSH